MTGPAKDNSCRAQSGIGRLVQRLGQRLGRDRNLVDVMRGAGLALVLRILGAGCAFVLNIAIGRLLGAEGAGLYFLALSVALILGVIGRLGLDHALLRFVSTEAAREDWDRVAGVFRRVVILVCGVGAALALGLVLASSWLAEWLFDEPGLAAPLRWIALSVVGFPIMMMVSEGLKGLRRVRDAMLVSGVIYPVVALALIWPLAGGLGASGAALAYAVGTLAAALYGVIVWYRTMAPHQAVPQFEGGTLWKSSSKLWVMSVIESAFLPWAPLFFLGIWADTAESGVFGAVTRLVMLLSFLLTAVNTVMVPKIAQMQESGDTAGLARLVRRMSLVVTLTNAPIFLIMILGSTWLMGLFGPEFIRGAMALSVVALGQVVNTVSGSSGHLLMLAGHERDIRSSALVGAGIMAVCVLPLIPAYGLLGAAIAQACAITGMGLCKAAYVRYRLGILMVPG